jgi:uncharacterized membrane protein YjgN (DUF898 family)
MLFAPWSMTLFKRYQHNGYCIAGQHARVKLSTAKVYLLSLKTMGMALLPMIVAGLLVALAFGLSASAVRSARCSAPWCSASGSAWAIC